MDRIRLAIADGHKSFRKSITKLIHLESDLEVVLLTENGKQLLERLNTITPDIILMDICMPEMNGFEIAEKLRELHPRIKIIVFSLYDLEHNIIEMYSRGVKSFIRKDDALDELYKAIRIVYDGGAYMTNNSIQIIQNCLKTKHVENSLENFPENLSESEISVLKCIIKGMSSTDIGNVVYRSHRTVEKYREELYKKFNVTSKKELIEAAHKLFYPKIIS